MPESCNGHRPIGLEGKVRVVGLGPRVIAWMDVAIGHLIADHRRRALVRRSRETDDWLERVVHRLRRRHH
jgi:hypothetical protein